MALQPSYIRLPPCNGRCGHSHGCSAHGTQYNTNDDEIRPSSSGAYANGSGSAGFFVNLMGGLLYAVTGLLMVSHPGLAAVTLTFMIAMLLIVAGTFRIFVAFSTPIHHRGWLILNGVISLFLGFSIMSSWPVSGLWIIGLFIGIDMIFDGWTEVMLALSSGSGGGPTPPQAAPA